MKRRRGRLPLQKGVAMICPKRNKEFSRLRALSRVDNKTMICDECGTKEALDAAGLLDNSSMRTAIIREVRKRNI